MCPLKTKIRRGQVFPPPTVTNSLSQRGCSSLSLRQSGLLLIFTPRLFLIASFRFIPPSSSSPSFTFHPSIHQLPISSVILLLFLIPHSYSSSSSPPSFLPRLFSSPSFIGVHSDERAASRLLCRRATTTNLRNWNDGGWRG